MLDDTRRETVSQAGNGEPGTKEAEALAAALNHSAERVQTLWFSFLTFMVYLAIATGTTTHRMLFLESPLNLPVLNIALPLLGFYILTPIIFVVFHFYMLLNLVLLARTAKSFEGSLTRAFPEDEEARETFRMRIENTLFVQLLVGGRLEREGINAKLLSLMALISLALAPVVLLLCLQIKFLPYHSEWITWLHRGLLALDLALVWTLWPGYRSGWGVRLRPKRSWRLVVPGVLSAAALAYAVMVATFPDERMYLATLWLSGSNYSNPFSGQVSSRYMPNWDSLTAPVNTLDLVGEDLIDDAKLAHILEKNESSPGGQRWVATLLLKDRDLTEANLRETDVRHADFSGAILNRANLAHSWANQARFSNAQLEGAQLPQAHLDGALLNGAQLRGPNLYIAELHGAELSLAQLQGAKLDWAKLQGATLDLSQLQGASLDNAKLRAASLQGAALQGASLRKTQLQGAVFYQTQMQAADLSEANLRGALLDSSGLQGTSLTGAQLQGASLSGVFVWRANAREADWTDARIEGVEIGTKKVCYDPGLIPPGEKENRICPWTVDTFHELKRLITQQVPEEHHQAAFKRTEKLDPNKILEDEREMEKIWIAHSSASDAYKTVTEKNVDRSTAPDVYLKYLTEQWRMWGCAAEGAPYVVHSLLTMLEGYAMYDNFSATPSLSFDNPEAPKLATAFLDEAHCAGAHGLSEADKATLKKIRDRAPPAAPQAPKP